MIIKICVFFMHEVRLECEKLKPLSKTDVSVISQFLLLVLVAAFTGGGLGINVAISTDDVSWVARTPRSLVPVSMHLLAFQLNHSQPGLIAPRLPPQSLLVLIQGT